MAKNGTEAIVARIPDCDIHKYDKKQPGVPAEYDARSRRGQWGYMCQKCFDDEGAKLGTGYGQRLVLKDNG